MKVVWLLMMLQGGKALPVHVYSTEAVCRNHMEVYNKLAEATLKPYTFQCNEVQVAEI